jgi:hypothetical protein
MVVSCGLVLSKVLFAFWQICKKQTQSMFQLAYLLVMMVPWAIGPNLDICIHSPGQYTGLKRIRSAFARSFLRLARRLRGAALVGSSGPTIMIEGQLLARFGGRHEDERLHLPMLLAEISSLPYVHLSNDR